MRSRQQPRHRTAVKKRNRRFIKRLITFISKTTRTMWNQAFEFCKTLPDSMKTAMIVSFLSVGAVLIPAINSLRNCVERQQPPPRPGDTICTDSQSDQLSPQSSQRLKSPRTTRQKFKLNSSPGTSVTAPDEHRLQALANARQTVRLGNYGDAYRQLKVISETLPPTERSRLAEDLSEANTMYQRGEFREAVYKIRDKVGGVLSINLNQEQ